MTATDTAWPKAPAPTTDPAEALLGPIPALARCDRCGAAAYASAIYANALSTLFFCSHHFRIHEAAIRSRAMDVRDERHRLVARELAKKPMGGVS